MYLLFPQFYFTCKNVCTISCKCFGRLDVVEKGYLASNGRTMCIELNGESKSQLWEHIVMYILID